MKKRKWRLPSQEDRILMSVGLFVVFIILMFTVEWVYAADITIMFRDSTNIEDVYINAAQPLKNYSRVTDGPPTRVMMIVANASGNRIFSLLRVTSFKDSCDNHPGLIIDSAKCVMFINTAVHDANDEEYIAAIGIDTNMNWVEGNNPGGDATDCQVCWDSAQTVGVGTCATKQEWATAGVQGTTDTLGLYEGEPEDSTHSGGAQIFDGEAAGDSIWLYLDTAMCNMWKDVAHANEGFVIQTWDGPSDDYNFSFYGSECNMTGAADSVTYVRLYGHTEEEGAAQTGRRRRIILGQ